MQKCAFLQRNFQKTLAKLWVIVYNSIVIIGMCVNAARLSCVADNGSLTFKYHIPLHER